MKEINTLAKPTLIVSALIAISLLTYGVIHQNRLEIADRHDGGIRNPFRGLPGCAYLTSAGTAMYLKISNASEAACDQAGDEEATWRDTEVLSNQSHDFMAAIAPIIEAPASSLPVDKKGIKAPNTITTISDKKIAKGRSVQLTLDAHKQEYAQGITDCMTGDAPTADTKDSIKPCEWALPNNPTWPDRIEGSAARMIGLVDIDIASGGINAMASSHSPCYRAYWLNELEQQGCPSLPPITKAQGWRLDNHARHTQAMPGSIDKPMLMLALLRSPIGAALHQERNWVLDTLKTSNSDALFDKLFCADRGFSADCARVDGLSKAAQDFGLTGGEINLLNHPNYPAFNVANARLLMAQVDGQWQPMPVAMPDIDQLKRCSANSYEKCAGEETAKLVSELWGQGNASASPLSAAQMISRLGAAANGQQFFAAAHMVTSVQDAALINHAAKSSIEPRHAKLIADGMRLTARLGGTAHSACVRVLGASACAQIDYISLKTGTPAFTHENLNMADRATKCEAIYADIASLKASGAAILTSAKVENSRCKALPYKWTVALVRDGSAGTPYTRAIAVLAERNYLTTGVIDSANDRGVNVAAEVAIRYINATRAEATTTQPKVARKAVYSRN